MRKIEDYISRDFPVNTFATFLVYARIIYKKDLFIGENYVEFKQSKCVQKRMIELLTSLGLINKLLATDELDLYERLIEDGSNTVLVPYQISNRENYVDAIYDCFVYSYMEDDVIRITFKKGE